MSDDLVKRARDALNGVTEGPWIDYEFSADHWVAFKSDDSGPAMRIGSWHDQREANARFIAASRDLVPAMADRIEELGAKLVKAVEEAEKYQHAFAAQSRKLQAVLHIEGVRATLAELTGGKDE